MNSYKITIVFALCMALTIPIAAFSQLVDTSSPVSCNLPNGEKITLFPALETLHGYYCMPANLRLSISEENQPEFLLMLWAGEGEPKVDNGIMHWLITWGLDKEQEKEVQTYLTKSIDSLAVLLGPVTVNAPEKYIITGNNKELVGILDRSVTSGKGIPTTAGSKSATSFRIKGPDAYKIQQYGKDPEKWKGAVIEMPFSLYNRAYEITLRLDAQEIMKAAAKCDACFISPTD